MLLVLLLCVCVLVAVDGLALRTTAAAVPVSELQDEQDGEFTAALIRLGCSCDPAGDHDVISRTFMEAALSFLAEEAGMQYREYMATPDAKTSFDAIMMYVLESADDKLALILGRPTLPERLAAAVEFAVDELSVSEANEGEAEQ